MLHTVCEDLQPYKTELVLTTVLLVASVALPTVQLAVAFPPLRYAALGFLAEEPVLRTDRLAATELGRFIFATAAVRIAVADPLRIDALVGGDASELFRRLAREVV